MTEAWLFADPNGTVNSGVPASQTVRLKADTDPEAFETDDPAYDTDMGADCAQLLDRNRRRRESRRPPWVKAPQPESPLSVRQRDPKAYLQWLCRDPKENSCTSWKESRDGARALELLDWSTALVDAERCVWLRALVDDLADGLGECCAALDAHGRRSMLTARKREDPSAVLRNL